MPLLKHLGVVRFSLMSHWQALSWTLHFAAVALWLGGACFFLIVFAPAARALTVSAAIAALDHGRRSFEMLAWIALGALILTGIASLWLRPQAGATLGRFYVIALTIKLLLVVAMIYHHGLQVFKYGRRIAAMTRAARQGSASWPDGLRDQWQKWLTALKINAVLGFAVALMGMALLKS